MVAKSPLALNDGQGSAFPRVLPAPPPNYAAMLPLILVVDDEPVVLELIRRALEGEAEVIVAPDPVTALEAVERFHPDLLIIDMGLPGIHGLQLVGLLRGDRLTPAIAITGGIVDEDEVQAAGFSAFLLKPFQVAELRRVVRDHLA